MHIKTVLLLQIISLWFATTKKPSVYKHIIPSAKHDNPNYVRDRYKNEIKKPQLPKTWWDKERKPFDPSWMDYCAPYHCSSYHKTACGLNRGTMRFKYFQSECHIILNNMCATYRGSLKYDIIERKYCDLYVMNVRSSCPRSCEGPLAPTCGISSVDNHAVLFRNRCALDVANCNTSIPEYEEVSLNVCDYYIRHDSSLSSVFFGPTVGTRAFSQKEYRP